MISKDLEKKLGEAAELAKSKKHEFVTLEHLLLVLTEHPNCIEILEGVGAQIPEIRKYLHSYLRSLPSITQDQIDNYGGFESWSPEFTLAFHRLIQRAALQVRNSGKSQVQLGTLLVCFFYEKESHALYSLIRQGVTQFDLISYLSHGIEKGDENDENENPFSGQGEPTDDEDAESGGKKSALEDFCINLNDRARKGGIDPLVGRDLVLERMEQVLLRKTKNNPLLVGEPGVGKTALAEGLALRINEGTVPESLKNKIIYSLDMGSLLAGTKFRGDFEGRLKNILKEIKKRKNIILFIDEIHTIIGAGSTSGGSMDASNLLKPVLAQGQLSCIGSTTYQEYRQHFEKDRALHRRFQKVDINEPTAEETLQILNGLKATYEKFHRVEYSAEALQAIVTLAQKHLHGKHFPDKAIDIMDETGAKLRLKDSHSELLKIGVREIEETMAQVTGIPMAQMSTDERASLKDLDKKLKSVIFGQDKAVDQLVTAIKLSRSGLVDRVKPVGSFLFAGPTGVGKTEVCKQLALIMGIPFKRFDMGEYMEKHSVSKLIGAPPGYVGYESGGLLTESITQSPYCVLLLDEMEKAHPDIAQSLLQVMDAARLTDSQGRVTDFKNVILVMTTNAGAIEMSKGNIGLANDGPSIAGHEALKKAFSPEFTNRLDAVVVFGHLDASIVKKVAEKFVDELAMSLAEKKVEFKASAEVMDWLVEKGYDKAYGARPMARTVDEHLKKPLVDELLFGKLAQGGKVTVTVEKQSLNFKFGSHANSERQRSKVTT
ncbi:MAG: ATP-dependent Clp protease ATP-binding subunit ClpA [Bdellovibrionota bacterium]